MDLNLRDLEYFIAVVDQRHFGRAAQAVKVSQPTLSMQLRKLEELLGGKLIERMRGDAIPTGLGEDVLPLAREMLRLASEIKSRSERKGHRGRFRLGVIPTISPYLLPKITRGLSRGIEGRRVTLLEAQTRELIRSVRDGTIDVAIVSTPNKERGLEERAIYSEPFLLAVSKSHVLAERRTVHLRDLLNERLLLLGEGHCLRNQALSLCKFSRVEDETDLSATSIETLRSMVAIGDGVTLIPKLAVRRGEGISYIPFSESSTARLVGLIFRPSFADMSLIDALAELVREAAMREELAVV